MPYIILDIETTGLYPEQSEIIEIGALKIEKKDIKDIFNPLIKPKSPIPKNIEDLTNISDNMLKNHPDAERVLPDFITFISETTLIAHNAEFDMGFLKYHILKVLGKELSNPNICTLKLAKALLPGLNNHKLHTIANYYKIPIPNRHRALGDAEITYQVWLKLLDELKKKEIITKDRLFSLLNSL